MDCMQELRKLKGSRKLIPDCAGALSIRGKMIFFRCRTDNGKRSLNECNVIAVIMQFWHRFRSKAGSAAVFLFLFCLCMGSPAACALTEASAAVNNRQGPEAERDALVRMMNLNLHYILHDWWKEERDYAYASSTNSGKADTGLTEEQRRTVEKSALSFADWRNAEELCVPFLNREQAENGIRSVAHAIYCISLALYYDYYDEEITGVSRSDAEAMCIKLLSAVTGEHRANHPDTQDDECWGGTWQSALWAENIGLGAWLLRDRMYPAIYAKAERMVLDEAYTLMHDYEIPYYMDKDGTILFPGDTKGEEIAWNAKLLALACFMFPDSEERPDWTEKLERMLVSAAAMPEDVSSERLVDGRKVSEMISGSNINDDGTVVNHNLYHIDYMATILEEMGDTIILYIIAGEPVPEAAVFNLDKIYKALIYVDLGKYDESRSGQNFYIRDETGRPTGNIGMPGENDWGKAGYAIYYLCDVTADTMGLDTDIEEGCKARVWQEIHFEKMREQIDREGENKAAGQFFLPGENSFISVEPFMMHNLAEAYLLKTQCFE